MKHTQRMRFGLLLSAVVLAGAAAAAQDDDGSTLAGTSAVAERDLAQSLEQLAALRESIAAEKLPLTRRLSELENRLIAVRAEAQEQGRALDSSNLDLTSLQTEIAARKEQNAYLSTLLDEYIRNLETRVHIAELQRYRDELELARLAPENASLAPAEVFRIQSAAVETSLDRLAELLGGTTFAGSAVGPDGRINQVSFALVGPIALYGAPDGSSAGLAEQRLGSLEPNMVPLAEPELAAQVRQVVESKRGVLPLDPTQGNAQKVEATRETLEEHIVRGGPVMIPILLLAGAALVVVIAKWIQVSRIRRPRRRDVEALLDAVRQRDLAGATKLAGKLPGPTGEMLRAGLEHFGEPKELVEEVMFEQALATRLRMQSFLSFVAVSAAAAPLLGLLGTVTGIINTFKLITVFGTGDAKTLSSGISEALITTEFGLIVAIPSLLLHAYLSRKSRRIVDEMEKVAVSFLNRLPGSPAQDDDATEAIADRVWQLLARRAAQEGGRAASEPAGSAAWPLAHAVREIAEH